MSTTHLEVTFESSSTNFPQASNDPVIWQHVQRLHQLNGYDNFDDPVNIECIVYLPLDISLSKQQYQKMYRNYFQGLSTFLKQYKVIFIHFKAPFVSTSDIYSGSILANSLFQLLTKNQRFVTSLKFADILFDTEIPQVIVNSGIQFLNQLQLLNNNLSQDSIILLKKCRLSYLYGLIITEKYLLCNKSVKILSTIEWKMLKFLTLTINMTVRGITYLNKMSRKESIILTISLKTCNNSTYLPSLGFKMVMVHIENNWSYFDYNQYVDHLIFINSVAKIPLYVELNVYYAYHCSLNAQQSSIEQIKKKNEYLRQKYLKHCILY